MDLLLTSAKKQTTKSKQRPSFQKLKCSLYTTLPLFTLEEETSKKAYFLGMSRLSLPHLNETKAGCDVFSV